MSTDKDKGPAPEIVLTDGALRAASWREEGEYGPFFNTRITRRYTNAEGDVRETTSLRERDLLPAAELTAQVHRSIRDRKRDLAQERKQSQSHDLDHTEDWHDEDMTRKDIQRERFKTERQSQGTRRRQRRGPSRGE